MRQLAGCSAEGKRLVLDRVLRDLIGNQPEHEYGLYNPDGTPYLFLVPPRLRLQLDLTPERLAELEESSRSPQPTNPLSELLARLPTVD